MEFDSAVALQTAMIFTARMATPIILVASAVGVFFAIVQAVTQISDQTLSMGAKLAAVGLVVALLGHGFGTDLLNYTTATFGLIARIR